MHLYSILIDSAKLFFINVFIYTIFLESYIFALLFQRRYGVELPFVTLFIAGIFTFIAVTVWINLARVWYQKLKSIRAMLIRAACSEVPFVLLLGIILASSIMAKEPFGNVSDAQDLLVAFAGYLIIFPLVMAMTKSHAEKVESM